MFDLKTKRWGRGNPVSASKLIPFNTLIETYGLSDLKIIGAKWIWMNKQHDKSYSLQVGSDSINDEWYDISSQTQVPLLKGPS